MQNPGGGGGGLGVPGGGGGLVPILPAPMGLAVTFSTPQEAAVVMQQAAATGLAQHILVQPQPQSSPTTPTHAATTTQIEEAHR